MSTDPQAPVFGDPDIPNPTRSRGAGMDCGTRLTTSMGGPFPVQQQTPDQQWWRDNAQGRLAADPGIGAHAPLNKLRVGPDGTVDNIRLEPNEDTYIDLGGRGATDVAIGRP